MKCVNKNKDNEVMFIDLNVGDTFVYHHKLTVEASEYDEVYIKLPDNPSYNSLALGSKMLAKFRGYDTVIKVEGVFTYNN